MTLPDPRRTASSPATDNQEADSISAKEARPEKPQRSAREELAVEDIYPLSPMQQGMLFHALVAPQSGAYVEQLCYTLAGDLDVAAFVKAWRYLIDRHPVLRTSFLWEELEEPLQVVHRRAESAAAAEVTVHDWRDQEPEEQSRGFEALRLTDRQRGFELSRAPLLRLALVRMDDQRHELLWTFHHLLLDGWSLPLLLQEVFRLYQAFSSGQQRVALPPTRPFRDYIAWLQGQDRAAAEAFWRQTLAGFQAPTSVGLLPGPTRGAGESDEIMATQAGEPIPMGEPLPMGEPIPMGDQPAVAEQEVWLSAETTAALQALRRQHNLTMNALVQGAWALLLHRYSGEDDVLFGSTVSGRPPNLPGAERMIGLFINTLPVRALIPTDPEASLLAWLQELQAHQVELRQYEYTPLVDIHGWSEVPRSQPLFESIVIFENYPVSPADLTDRTGPSGDGRAKSQVRLENVRSFEQTNYPLTVVSGAAERLMLKISYDRQRFDDATIARMLGHLRTLVAGMAEGLDQPLSALPMLTEEEREQLLVTWNDTAREFEDLSVHRLFEAQVRRTPTATAAIHTTGQLSYQELNARANQLAHYLRRLLTDRGRRKAAPDQGPDGRTDPGPVVGLMVGRSPDMLVGLLGILKAGAAYLPLDPDYPAERLQYMMEDAGIELLVGQAGLIEGLELPQSPGAHLSVVRLDADGPEIEIEPTTDLDIEVRGEYPAYLIYTSGSTGAPKGVLVPHRALSNHAQAFVQDAQLGPGDRMLQFISLSFDAAAEEFYPTLISGAALVIPGAERDALGVELASFCRRHDVTILHMPASVWNVLVDDLAETGKREDSPFGDKLRLLTLGGDAPDVKRLRHFSELLGRPIAFLNLYGPTETTISSHRYSTTTDVDGIAVVPIGRPIANVTSYVLDAQQRPVPIGVPGELYIGGRGLALGYLGRPELTAERFVSNPFERSNVGTFKRLYRTGDLVRYLADGNLQFLGRSDDQLKIRGFRVEPGEIEAVLQEHLRVQMAVVVPQEEENGLRTLCAYVVAAGPTGDGLDPLALKAYLRKRLPDHMVPARIVGLAELPLTPSGKVDRRALADQAGPLSDGPGRAAAEPRTPEEEILVGLWSHLLHAPQIGVHDNFFDLGGHSLTATRLVSRVREVFQIELPVQALFDHPTVAELARMIVEQQRQDLAAAPDQPPIRPVPRDGRPLPLSFAQQRLWFLDQLEPGNLFYNIPTAMRLRGNLDVDVLRRSVNEIVRRHEVLRTTFVSEDGKPRQVIADKLTLDLPLVDLGELPEMEREGEALRRAAEMVRQPFDLAQGPLLRGQVLRLAEDDHLAVLVIHHIVSDGWSMSILMRELARLYQAISGQPADEALLQDAVEAEVLPPLSLQYADFAHWQRNWLQGETLTRQLDHWKQELAGLPPLLELTTDRPRPPVQTSRGDSYEFTVPRELTERLVALSQGEGVSLYMTLLAAYQTLLHRYSGQDDLAVGTAIANRNRAEVEGLIGFFVNTLVMRARFDGGDQKGGLSFRELLSQVRRTALNAFAHQDVPFEMLVDALQPERSLSHTPLFQAAFSLQNLPMDVIELPPTNANAAAASSVPGAPVLGALVLEPVSLQSSSTQFDMLLTVTETPDGLTAAWDYNADLFDRTTIQRMADHLQVMLEAVVADPDRPVSRLPLLTPAEQRQTLLEWNQTATPFPDSTTFHALFEEQAAVKPQALAAVFGQQELSYEELNRRANQLAHYLQSLGVERDDLVGIATPRSLDLVVGVLGALKAGAAFLPLDLAYPPDRLAFMIEDSGIKVLLTAGPGLGQALPELPTDLRSIRLDTDWSHIASFPEANLKPQPAAADGASRRAGPNSLAYVIYTSGSTGRPKGTLLEHRGLCNLARVQQRAFDLREGKRVLQFAPLSFDASVWEMAMALGNGSALVLAPQETLASGPELLRLLKEQRVTTVTLPPSLLAVLEPEELPELEVVVAAGERCTPDIVFRWMPGRRFFNAYGPTETTVCASMHLCSEEDAISAPPIGRPIDNFSLFVVDRHLQPVPVGVPGELLVGGVGLARGYHNRPELTAERFIRKPLHLGMLQRATAAGDRHPERSEGSLRPAAVADRIYRTGDLVRYRPNGEVDFLGRIDHQVKLRGFRIELGEIEANLNRHPGVKEAVALVREDRPGDARLVSYLICREQEADRQATVSGRRPSEELPAKAERPADGELRLFLRERLPEYMLPSAFVWLDAFPLSPSGKVDRQVLLSQAYAPDQARPDLAARYVAPRTPAEETLAGLVAELLGLERVGVEDSFFELGGHSLLATQLISRIREQFGVELPLRALFEQPTVAGLAAQAQMSSAQAGPAGSQPAITARSREARRLKRSELDRPS